MGETKSSQPAHYAILIGINAYPDKPLNGCVRDVQHIKSLLEQQQFPIEIQTFTATSDSRSGLVEDQKDWPTYENVTAVLRDVTARAQPGDCVYVHYSGHGTRFNPGSKFSNQHTGDLALALLNGEKGESIRELGGHRLAMALNAMVRKGLVVTVVLDCCFAASVYRHDSSNVRFIPIDPDLVSAFSVANDPVTQNEEPLGSGFRDVSMLPNWLINPNGYALLAACGPHEQANEITADGLNHGALSHFLFQSLRNGGLKKRHKDLFYRLSTKFRENSFDQNPILYGNKDQIFFGHSSLPASQTMIPVVRRGSDFVLQAGHAHGVAQDDYFMLYPSIVSKENVALHTNVRRAKAKTVRPLTSLLHLEDMITTSAQTDWVAEPQTRHALRKFSMSLDENMPCHDECVTSFDKHCISIPSTTNTSLPTFFIVLLDDEYQIRDGNNQQMRNIPVLHRHRTTPEDIAYILEHLARYELVKQLTNHSATDNFRASFDIYITTRAGSQFGPDCVIDVEQDNSQRYMFELCLKNNSSESLYLHIYDLDTLWQIESTYHASYAVVPPSNPSERFTGLFRNKMRTMVPDELREKGFQHCDDVLKVLITSHPTSFDLLELPKLGDLPPKQSPPKPDRSGDNRPEQWAAFNFPLRTSLPSNIGGTQRPS
ncbi:hypothetical protein NW762_014546 [Fusarium torreyae]|uniref:Peptidase C14 caspase domain-containing protein n=1 Tax=Fusarium torreyae TaxID=1237075 RepID=A0A9W8V981_9HYPO|nr:hypothetical protein NW762_014546 [Fusarium torreyae]